MTGFIADPAHVHRVRVGFGDCDPAGIVYFPRFFHFFQEAKERWFEDVLALPYAELIGVRKLGLPAVHAEADFRGPVAMGQEIAVEQRVVQLGRSSIRFAYAVRLAAGPADDVRLVGATVCVVMDLDPQRPTFRRAVLLPDDLRDRIAPHVAPAA